MAFSIQFIDRAIDFLGSRLLLFFCILYSVILCFYFFFLRQIIYRLKNNITTFTIEYCFCFYFVMAFSEIFVYFFNFGFVAVIFFFFCAVSCCVHVYIIHNQNVKSTLTFMKMVPLFQTERDIFAYYFFIGPLFVLVFRTISLHEIYIRNL